MVPMVYTLVIEEYSEHGKTTCDFDDFSSVIMQYFSACVYIHNHLNGIADTGRVGAYRSHHPQNHIYSPHISQNPQSARFNVEIFLFNRNFSQQILLI